MHYFVTFTYSPSEANKYDFSAINAQLEEIGLKNGVKAGEGEIKRLPAFTFIGEYNYQDKEELKNVLYNEIRLVFSRHQLDASVYISVSENATIGVDDLEF